MPKEKLYRASAISVFALFPLVAPAVGHAENRPDGSQSLTEIVVTARKRPENLQLVPVSETVLSGAKLVAAGRADFNALQTSIPNLSIADFANSDKANLVIRGVASNTRNAGFESGASFYIDGVYGGRPEGINTELLDIASVEVLRGPQGTVFGKNSIAGAVNITTNNPTFGFSSDLSAEVGNLNYRKFSGVINVPLTSTLSVRAAAYTHQRDGYVVNLANGDKYANNDSYGGRFKLLFKPQENFEGILSFDYLHEKRKPPFGETLDGTADLFPPPAPVVSPGPRTVDVNRTPFESREASGESLTLNYHLDNGATVSSITAGRRLKYRFGTDQDNSLADLIYTNDVDNSHQFSQELHYTSKSGEKFEYVLGLYYFRQDLRSTHIGGLGSDFAIPGLVPGGTDKEVAPHSQINTESFAVYADTTFKITSRLALLAGIRYTTEDKSATFSQTVNPLIEPLFYAVPTNADKESDEDVSPTVGLRYSISPAVTVYGKFARGFKSGGWNVDFISRSGAAPPPLLPALRFSPENLNSYEIGLKANLFDRKLRLSAAAFVQDYNNLQVSQFFGLNGGAVTTNAGAAQIKGLELEFDAAPIQNLTISGGLGLLDPKYKTFKNVNASGASADGKQLQEAAPVTGSLTIAYTLPIPELHGDMTPSISYSYRGAVYGDPLNTPLIKAPGFSLVNASLSYKPNGKAVDIYLWVDNLLNENYILGTESDPFAAGIVPLVAYGAPRTYGVRVSAHF